MTSFAVGLKNLQAHTEPRFVLLAGNEYKLREKLLAVALEDSQYEVHEIDAAQTDVWSHLFTVANRPSKTKQVVLSHAEDVDWTYLDLWLKKVKSVRLIADTRSAKLGAKLADKVRTRGMVVDCSTENNHKTSLVKYIATEYGVPVGRVKSLLEDRFWDISYVITLLENFVLLKRDYNVELEKFLYLEGEKTRERKFVLALLNDKRVEALALIPQLSENSIQSILLNLNCEIEFLARVRAASTAMKTVHELARELREDVSKIKYCIAVSKKYDTKKTLRSTLAVANAERDYSQGNRSGVLEILVGCW